MTNDMIPIEDWPNQLEIILEKDCQIFKNITVLNETDSTQDAARRNHAKPGDVIVASRQITGRGRLGRVWADTGIDGVALTCVVQFDQSERLAIAAAIGVAHAIESFLNTPVAIKWPNDIVVDDKKLAGILIEQTDKVAFIGIGINVNQKSWPRELVGKALSLAQLNVCADRLDVLCTIIPALDSALQMDDEVLVQEFIIRDSLCGRTMRFQRGNEIVQGLVKSIDPMRGLSVQSNGTDLWLPAATTTVL